MDFKLIWTESAIEDLGAIVRFISGRNGPEIARRVGFGIYDRVQVLITYPESGSALPERQDPHWRKLVFESWKIAYRIDQDGRVVYIVRIWHSAQQDVEIIE